MFDRRRWSKASLRMLSSTLLGMLVRLIRRSVEGRCRLLFLKMGVMAAFFQHLNKNPIKDTSLENESVRSRHGIGLHSEDTGSNRGFEIRKPWETASARTMMWLAVVATVV